MQEVWRSVVGYEGIYDVSNLGRVRSLKFNKEKIIKSAINSGGYKTFCFRKFGTRKTMSVHQLVAEAFLGHVPCGHKIVVDHIDNNKLNNIVNNLQLISQRENVSKNIINKTSKYTGVNFDKSRNKWQSRILIGGKRKHLGYFDNELDAYNAYIRKLEATN